MPVHSKLTKKKNMDYWVPSTKNFHCLTVDLAKLIQNTDANLGVRKHHYYPYQTSLHTLLPLTPLQWTAQAHSQHSWSLEVIFLELQSARILLIFLAQAPLNSQWNLSWLLTYWLSTLSRMPQALPTLSPATTGSQWQALLVRKSLLMCIRWPS